MSRILKIITPDILDIITWFIIAISLLKMIDMIIYSIIWDVRYGKRYSDKFHYYLRTGKYDINDVIRKIGRYGHDPMRLVKAIGSLPPKCIFKPVANYLYRWPSLTLLLSIMLITDIDKTTAFSAALVLIAMIVIEIIHQLVSRLTLGVADNINKYFYLNVVERSSPDEEIWHISRILRDCVATILIQVFCIIVSYASIFWILEKYCHIFKNKKALSNYIDAIYFSLVTVTTVGFGDITTKTSLGRLVSISQIVSVWILVVLLFAHYLATLSIPLDDVNSANKCIQADRARRGR